MECIRNRLLVKFWRITTRLGPKPQEHVVVGPGARDVSVADNFSQLQSRLPQMADFCATTVPHQGRSRACKAVLYFRYTSHDSPCPFPKLCCLVASLMDCHATTVMAARTMRAP